MGSFHSLRNCSYERYVYSVRSHIKRNCLISPEAPYAVGSLNPSSFLYQLEAN